ncbi:hypothetical protein Cantr_06566 [Candida viswanathii]|uniref:LMBR1 domain-containing protein 2 n=1 Tax=Candida viswanathii TaxID=5486 RepID=A0A367XVG9_9ASCO|nr:hypothetical protein Cantr_06566 [Candida viswanathii]
MWATFIIYILILLSSVAGINYHINVFKYPAYLTVPLTLAVFIPLSLIYLLPMDWTQKTSEGDLWLSLPDNVILNIWKANYWITFVLTWFLLPMLQEFYRSGYSSTWGKITDAFKENLKFQAMMLGVSLLGMLYLMFEAGLSFNHLKLMVIALAHIYSLILATWLMGHGLISIPRNCWIRGSAASELQHNYLRLLRLSDDLEDTKVSFKDDVLQVLRLKLNFTSDAVEDFEFRDVILGMYSKIPEDIRDQVERQYLHDNTIIERDQVTPSYMSKLQSGFNIDLHKYVGYESAFNSLVLRIIELEQPKTNEFKNWIRPVANRVGAVVLALVSFIILESEFFHSTKLSLLNVTIFTSGAYKHSTLQFLLAAAFFAYMLFAALSSLTQLKIFNMYHLVPRNSDPVLACWYTMYTARMAIPLSYNFIALAVDRTCIFEAWYGQSINLTGLFNLLNNWIPRLILVPVFLAMFHVYDKLKRKIGWANFDDDEDEDANDPRFSKIAEAKRIVNREISRRELQLRPFHLTNNGNTHEDLANLNYERNRREFHDSLSSNRIDHEEPEPVIYGGSVVKLAGLWSTFKDSINGWRNSTTNNNTNRPYRDNPVGGDDDEEEENLVL